MKCSEKNEFIKERWGVPLLNFEGGPGVPLLNLRGVLDLTFKLLGGSWVPGPRVPGSWSHFYTMLDLGSEKYISLNIEVIRQCKRTGMWLILGTDFSKLGVYSKSVTKTLYGKFLVSEGIFKLVCHYEKCRWSDNFRAWGILVKNLWTDCWIVNVAYLQKEPQ